MPQNILITGAAGYIGGSILADILKQEEGQIKNASITAVVRSDDQVEKLAKLGINVVKLDFTDKNTVEEIILGQEIDIVLHVASSHDPSIVGHMIVALGQRRRVSGRPTSLVHTSGTTAFAPEAGWPAEEVKDTDNVYEIEKRISANHPIRLTNARVIENGETHGVDTFIVVVPSVYGKGTGEGKKISLAFPIFIRASIKANVVHQFDQDGTPAAAHISDIVSFYRLLIEAILSGKTLRSGKEGYYFPIGHKTSNWAVMAAFAKHLHADDLVDELEPLTWPNDEAAAEALGVPAILVRIMGTHSINLTDVKPFELGWKPQWDEEMLLGSIDQEIQNVLDEDRS